MNDIKSFGLFRPPDYYVQLTLGDLEEEEESESQVFLKVNQERGKNPQKKNTKVAKPVCYLDLQTFTAA